ncbi:MAG: PEP-CTERM sorting domain-containing protein [Aquabacterium sp.]|nr:MAG: PEP-CTERM sorting domain-containing protein [Aquabacterium sp.]
MRPRSRAAARRLDATAAHAGRGAGCRRPFPRARPRAGESAVAMSMKQSAIRAGFRNATPALALAAALCALPAHAGLITMDELPLQPADGLHVGGVLFSYSVDGQPDADASFASYGVGDLAYIQDPSLEGATRGTLRIAFDTPVSRLAFGIALQSEQPQDDSVLVSLLDADGRPFAELALDTAPLVAFSETRFDYAGAPVFAVTLGFANRGSRFVLDNLEFTSAVPEPASAVLLAAGLLLLGRRRR